MREIGWEDIVKKLPLIITTVLSLGLLGLAFPGASPERAGPVTGVFLIVGMFSMAILPRISYALGKGVRYDIGAIIAAILAWTGFAIDLLIDLLFNLWPIAF